MIKAFVDSLDDVPEGLRDQYKKHGDGFRLEVDGVEFPEDVQGLRTALKTERDTRKDLDKRLKELERIDPEKYDALVAAAEKAERDDQKKKGDWEAREAALVEKHQQELAEKDTRIGVLTTALEDHLIEAAATQAIHDAQGEPVLLLPHIRTRAKLVEDDGANGRGRFTAQILDEHGHPAVTDGQGTPMSMKALVESMKADKRFGRAFAASDAGGSDSRPGDKGGGAVKTVSRSDQEALNANIEGIASGEVTVVD